MLGMKHMELLVKDLITEILFNIEDKKSDKEYEMYQKYLEMSAYENDLINQNIEYIAGIDEVGRGPLAGPVVSCAVILPKGYYLPGLTDSKKLSEKKREFYYDKIINDAISYGVGIVDVSDIDKFNIYNCTKISMIQAVNKLAKKPDHLLIDAMSIDINIPQTSVIKGDEKSISIAAASIIAKVTRDRYMEELAKEFPEYHFEKNKGYGTKEHLLAIEKFGPTIYHRKTFSPIKEMLQRKDNLFNIDL